jgi:hypothetical protein
MILHPDNELARRMAPAKENGTTSLPKQTNIA